MGTRNNGTGKNGTEKRGQERMGQGKNGTEKKWDRKKEDKKEWDWRKNGTRKKWDRKFGYMRNIGTREILVQWKVLAFHMHLKAHNLTPSCFAGNATGACP